MATPMQHPMFETLEGHAELAIPAKHISARKIPIRFHPQTLCFEAFFDPADEVVDVLASELESVAITLHNVVLHDSGRTVRLKADGLQLYRSNALHEWPEHLGVIGPDCESDEKGTRRLELVPQEQMLRFTADAEISTEHPYQVYYGNACTGVRAPSRLRHSSLPAEVSFCRDFPQRGMLCAFSEGDFLALEERIRAACMLIHGQGLPLVLQIQGREIRFYGHKVQSKSSYLALVDDGGSALPDSVMNGFLDMEHEWFNRAYLALKYFVTGKQADVAPEAQYMMLMTCVEAMDEMGDLQEATTAALLGIEPSSAKLLNCLRNKLVHGVGGYEQAFSAVLQEDFKNKRPVLELGFQPCLNSDGTLAFVLLWLRLCERLDAFWCSFIGVDPRLVTQRCIWLNMSLMPAIDHGGLLCAVQSEKNKKQKKNDTANRNQAELNKLRKENHLLHEQVKQLQLEG